MVMRPGMAAPPGNGSSTSTARGNPKQETAMDWSTPVEVATAIIKSCSSMLMPLTLTIVLLLPEVPPMYVRVSGDAEPPPTEGSDDDPTGGMHGVRSVRSVSVTVPQSMRTLVKRMRTGLQPDPAMLLYVRTPPTLSVTVRRQPVG